MQDGCKVYMDASVATNGSCFMVTWIVIKNDLSKVGLTQNQETMALRMLPTIGSFHFIMVQTRGIQHSLKWHLVEGPITYNFTLHLRVRDHTT